jgi:PAS domain S-box-containing protein
MSQAPQAQHALIEQLEWFPRQIGTGVVVTDTVGRVQWVNVAFEQLSGYRSDELQGRKPGELLQRPDTDAATVARMRDAVARHEPFLVEVLNYTRDGHPYWVQIDCHPLHGADGRFEGFIALEIDITARRHAEQSVLDSERRYRRLFEFANDAILVADDAGRYVDANPAAADMLGYTVPELCARSVLDLVADRDATPRWQSFVRDGVQQGEVDLRTRDGRLLTTEYTAVRDFLPGLHLSIMRDRSERRLADARARRSDRLEALGTLAGGIAHDFNNVLTGMLGHLAVLQHELSALPLGSASSASLQAIADGGQRARELVQRILSFSRLHEPTRTPTQLAPVVDEAMRLLRALLPASVALRVDIDANVPPVLGDGTAVHQALTNLCTNAWHALPATGGTIEVQLDACAEAPQRPALEPLAGRPAVRLTVRDNGHGMDESTRARIFEPLFTTKAPGAGTGLGLAGVQSVVNAHGGAVEVRSEPGRGSEFVLWFPALAADTVLRASVDADPVPTGRGERVVLVDDDAQTLHALERMLQHLGYAVEAYGDAREALARIVGSPTTVHAMVSDLTMPSLTGDVLATACREVVPTLPVVVLSGYLTDALREALTAQAVVTLDKPPSLHALGEAIITAAHVAAAGCSTPHSPS